MGKKQTYQIGSEFFEKQTLLKERCCDLLDKYRGEISNPQDIIFLSEFIKRHHDYDNIIGIGFKSFSVNEIWGSRCFFVNRIDNSCTSFSYGSCITKKSPVKKALRNEIQYQIDIFRKNCTEIYCALCGKIPFKEHIDHFNPDFIVLVNSFLIDFPIIEICGQGADDREERNFCPWGQKEKNKTWIKNRTIAKKWTEFHELKANLRLTCASCNLRRDKKKRKILPK